MGEAREGRKDLIPELSPPFLGNKLFCFLILELNCRVLLELKLEKLATVW